MNDYLWRNDSGQFHNLGNGASYGEQAVAGVNHTDDPFSASAKVEMARRAQGRNIYTGIGPDTSNQPQPYYGGFSGASIGHRAGPIDENQSWAVVKGLLKAIFYVFVLPPLLIAAALWTGKALDGPTMARRAANELPAYALRPSQDYLPGKDLGSPVSPAAFVAQVRSKGPKKRDPTRAVELRIYEQAYKCLFQAGCRDGVAKLDAELGWRLPSMAGRFLTPLVAKGDARAARDMCMLPILTGSSYQDALLSRANCREAIFANPKLHASVESLRALENTWTMRLALAYQTLANLGL